jgi:hypothetical protein
MGFKIRGTLRDMRKKNAWRNRAALNVATIGRRAPDVIGLQECQRGNLKAYRKTCRDTLACVGSRREA